VKTSFKVIACMAALAVLLTVQSASAQGKLQGAWKITEIVFTGPNALTFKITQPSQMIFTQKHFSVMMIKGDESRPDLPQEDPTYAQMVAVWTPFAAAGGTYEVKGTTFTAKTSVAKDPSRMAPGNFLTFDFKVEGNTLVVTPKASAAGPISYPPSIKLTRLE